MVRNTLSTDEFVVLPYPFQRGPAVCVDEDTLAVILVIPDLPDILVAVGESVGALAVRLIVPPLPDILVAVG